MCTAVAVSLVALTAVLAGCTGGDAETAPEQPPPKPPAQTSRPPAPQPRRIAGPHDSPVPILMYHVISPAPPAAPYPELYVPPESFAGQMRWLVAHGYHGVTLRQVVDYWQRGIALPRRPIVVSFDDGYRSQYVNAFPVLRKLGWPGVLNLKVGNESDPTGMPVPVARRLVKAGWEIGAHTITHPDLTNLDAASLRREVAGSRTILRRQLGVPVDFFCYPAGRYDARVIAAVRAAGYVGATTTNPGLARPDRLYELARVRVNGSDGVAALASRLAATKPG